MRCLLAGEVVDDLRRGVVDALYIGSARNGNLRVWVCLEKPWMPVSPTASMPDPAHETLYMALAIGNNAYQGVGLRELTKCETDARDMGSLLSQLGYRVSLCVNGTKDAMENAVICFVDKLHKVGRGASGRVAVVHYSGHGLERDGELYLAPIDCTSTTVDSECWCAHFPCNQCRSLSHYPAYSRVFVPSPPCSTPNSHPATKQSCVSLGWLLDTLRMDLSGSSDVLVVLLDTCRSQFRDGTKGPDEVGQRRKGSIVTEEPPALCPKYVSLPLKASIHDHTCSGPAPPSPDVWVPNGK